MTAQPWVLCKMVHEIMAIIVRTRVADIDQHTLDLCEMLPVHDLSEFSQET